MWKMDIKGDMHFIRCKEEFVQLVEIHMGRDAADWLKAFIQEGMEALEGAEFLTLLDDCLADVSSRIEEANDEIKAKVERVAKGDLPPMWA